MLWLACDPFSGEDEAKSQSESGTLDAGDASVPVGEDGGETTSEAGCETRSLADTFSGSTLGLDWLVDYQDVHVGTFDFDGGSRSALLATASFVNGGSGAAYAHFAFNIGTPRSVDLSYAIFMGPSPLFTQLGCTLSFRKAPDTVTTLELAKYISNYLFLTAASRGVQADGGQAEVAQLKDETWYGIDIHVDISDSNIAFASIKLTDIARGQTVPANVPSFSVVEGVQQVRVTCGILYTAPPQPCGNNCSGTTFVAIDDLDFKACLR